MSEACSEQVETTRAIDMAVGILVGWRRCSTQTAFRELLSASERQQVPLFAMAEALVRLASRHDAVQTANVTAEQGAQRQWGTEFVPGTERQPVNRWL
jgi:hypothetical protein